MEKPKPSFTEAAKASVNLLHKMMMRQVLKRALPAKPVKKG